MGLGDPLLSFPDQPGQPGARRNPTTAAPTRGTFGTLGLERGGGWGSLAGPQGLCPCVCSWPPRSLSPGSTRDGRRPFSLSLGTRAHTQLLSLCKGPLEAPACPAGAPASQEALPEGHCISMVTVLGVPPPASPSSAPSRRARWKTTLRGSHSRCDLSLPARK